MNSDLTNKYLYCVGCVVSYIKTKKNMYTYIIYLNRIS